MPPYTNPTLDSYATLDHILCRIEHQKLFRSIPSLPHMSLPWFHRHCLLPTKFQLPYFLSPKTAFHLGSSISPAFPQKTPMAPAQTNITFLLKTLPVGEYSLKAFSSISMAQSALSLFKPMDLTTLPSCKLRLKPLHSCSCIHLSHHKLFST